MEAKASGWEHIITQCEQSPDLARPSGCTILSMKLIPWFGRSLAILVIKELALIYHLDLDSRRAVGFDIGSNELWLHAQVVYLNDE
ncbi:hypothetical protein RRG08_017457 [Elysia crispata]|uniref:Uncharacterized protein n=1 Tax=Elysia crispata TaxID=231223 RepID=A0AAE0YIT7_9GAST|nr:hypothetical protein RRG08_017457 [Elysia crispata]